MCNNKNYKKASGFLRAEPLSSYFEDRKGHREGKKLLSAKSVFPSLTATPIDDDAKKHNENLSGMGGVFNTVNLHLYHYAGNNPVKYVDPDGRNIILLNRSKGAGGFGHNAVLIGSNKDGWIYYSKDGKEKGKSINIKRVFTTLDNFKNANKTDIKLSYDKGYRLTATSEKDKKMQNFTEKRFGKEYAVFAKDTEFVIGISITLKRGFPTITDIYTDIYIGIIQNNDNIKENCGDLTGKTIEYGGYGSFFPSLLGGTLPNRQYKNLKKAHPEGKEILFQ